MKCQSTITSIFLLFVTCQNTYNISKYGKAYEPNGFEFRQFLTVAQHKNIRKALKSQVIQWKFAESSLSSCPAAAKQPGTGGNLLVNIT